MNLHNEIMSIECNDQNANEDYNDRRSAYQFGHRDARHAAAELSLKAEARIEELESVLSKFVNWTTNEDGTTSLGDDVQLWELAEKVLENK